MPPTPSADPSDFDFWVGEWDLSWPDDGHGRNVISRVLDGRVVLEQFDGRPGTEMRGMSVSSISPETGLWHQTWVDSEGGYLDFRGGMRGEEMVLERTATRDGATIRQRMVWSVIGPDALDWRWQRSTDDGATWETAWPISYRRTSPP